MTNYPCIMVDPPWPEYGGGKIKRGADRHYALLSVPEIISTILTAPCWRPDPVGCHLWLWSPGTQIANALFVIQALGFRYVNMCTWLKTSSKNDGSGCPVLAAGGLGQYFACNTEYLLFGVRGRLSPLRRHIAPTGILAPRRGHSVKPVEVYTVIETVSIGPRLEMFARGVLREGWDGWGNEYIPE